MQRTLPPAESSISSMAAVTTRPFASLFASLRHGHHGHAIRGAQLEHVAGERFELVEVQGDELVPGGLEPLKDGRTLVVARDRGVTDHGEFLADRHQYIGVIDGDAVPVERLERDHVVVHALRKIPEYVEMGAGREARIRDTVRAIEDHAAGAFQEMSCVFVVGQVDDLPHLETELGIEPVDDIGAPLAAAVLRLHGIEHDGAVRVKADPVVGKYRVRCMRLERIVEHVNLYPGAAQDRNQALELRQRRPLLLGRGRIRCRLESIRIRRLRIALEARRPDHQDARCQL
jgi:hypothetical protein